MAELNHYPEIIKRDLLEALIEKYLREASEIRKIIGSAGDHYTYRDRIQFCFSVAGELETAHLHLLCDYIESTRRIRAIRDRVYEEFKGVVNA